MTHATPDPVHTQPATEDAQPGVDRLAYNIGALQEILLGVGLTVTVVQEADPAILNVYNVGDYLYTLTVTRTEGY
jgi:hypothetical protein